MSEPPLLSLTDEAAFRAHFEVEFVKGPAVITYDGIRIRFYANQFDHAFYIGSTSKSGKDTFSLERAQRMTWVRAVATDPNMEVYRRVMTGGRVRRIMLEPNEPYVVICEVLSSDPSQAVFITAYPVKSKSALAKMRSNPRW